MAKSLSKMAVAVLSVMILIGLLSDVAVSENESLEYYFHRNDKNRIALTFDDGPHPFDTIKILNILDKYNVKATFFVIGQNAVNYRDALKEIVKRGHEIGNHTYTHTVIKSMSTSDIINEVESCREVIYDISGENTVLFRPPEGLMAQVNSEDAELFEGYEVILWSVDTMDWSHNSPKEIARYVSNKTKSGDIILMHDYIGYNSPTPEALELLLPDMINKGFEFVTISELLAS